MIDFIKNKWILLTLLGGATILSFLWLFLFNRKRLNAKWWDLLLAAISATIVGVLGTILMGMIESGFKVTDATSLFGSIFIVPLFCLAYAKIRKLPYLTVLDVFTIVLVISAMMARINCLISGCCFGKYIGTSDVQYPVREIEIGFDVIFIGVAGFCIVKEKLKNKIYFVYLISYGFVRFILESMRYSEQSGFFHFGHAWALLSFFGGIALLIIQIYLEKDKNNGNKKKR